MLKLLSANNHKKKTLIKVESLLGVKNPLYRWNLYSKFWHYHSQMPLNIVISTGFPTFLGLYTKDFYINTDMYEYTYIWLPR